MKKLLLIITLLLAGYSQLTGEILVGWNLDKEHCLAECQKNGYCEYRVEWRTTGNKQPALACLCDSACAPYTGN